MTEFDYGRDIPAGYYDAVLTKRRGPQSKWHQLKFRYAAERLPTQPGVLVDIGCGPGSFSAFVPARFGYHGFDVAKAQIEYARRTYGSDSHRFDVLAEDGRLPLADATAAVVVSLEVVEHLTPPQNRVLVGEAWRVLKPGGTLLLTTPNYRSLWPVLEWLLNRVALVTYEEQHISRFRASSLSGFLHEQGVSDVRINTFQFIAPFAAFLSWQLADAVYRLEKVTSTFGFGNLLCCQAVKPVGESNVGTWRGEASC